jgi:hypothetical protein
MDVVWLRTKAAQKPKIGVAYTAISNTCRLKNAGTLVYAGYSVERQPHTRGGYTGDCLAEATAVGNDSLTGAAMMRFTVFVVHQNRAA